MDRPYDAREVLEGLVGKTVHVLKGRPNTVLGIESDQVRVGTGRSPQGTPAVNVSQMSEIATLVAIGRSRTFGGV